MVRVPWVIVRVTCGIVRVSEKLVFVFYPAQTCVILRFFRFVTLSECQDLFLKQQRVVFKTMQQCEFIFFL